MAVTDTTRTLPARLTRSQARAYAAGGLRFDFAAALLSTWMVLGLYVDGWAHNNLPGRLETFFTPWHGVLYSGFLAVSVFHFYHQARHMSRGHAWDRSLPQGYLLSLLGVLLFGFGGGFDMTWHNLFGFEADVEALLSPAHLLLASGALLFNLGPLRAAWHRSRAETPAGWRGLLPAWLSLCQLLAVSTFFTQYLHVLSSPALLVRPPGAEGRFYRDIFGVGGAIVPAALMMFVVLLALRRWRRLPPGALSLLFGSNVLLMAWASYGDAERRPLVLAALLGAGALADGLLWALRPGPDRPAALRLFAFAVPCLFFLAFFLAMINTSGIWWAIHMWLGASLLAGVAGLGLSYLAVPPALPAGAE